MNQDEIKAFANRNWKQLSDLDRSYWAVEYQRNGSITAQKASQALWQHMKSIRPEWPDTMERKRDLENHLVLKKLFHSIANVLSSC